MLCIDTTPECIDNTLMQKISLTIRVDAEEKAKWQEAASASKQGLSEWIRERCNETSPNKKLPRTASVPLSERRSNPRPRSRFGGAEDMAHETIQDEVPVSPRGAVCKHGIAKGWNCWQCGGLAIIKKAEN